MQRASMLQKPVMILTLGAKFHHFRLLNTELNISHPEILFMFMEAITQKVFQVGKHSFQMEKAGTNPLLLPQTLVNLSPSLLHPGVPFFGFRMDSLNT